MATSKASTAQARVVRSKEDLDHRQRVGVKAAFKSTTITLDVSDDDDEVFQNFDLNGIVKILVFDTPDLGGDTVELKVIGNRGEELYTTGEKADTTQHVITSSLPTLAGDVQLKLETSGTQSSDKKFFIGFYYR